MNEVKLGPKHTGMRWDIASLVSQYSERLPARGSVEDVPEFIKVRPGDIFVISEVCRLLAEVGRRYYAGDAAAVDEFLQLFCFDECRQKDAQRMAPSSESAP